MRRLGSSLRIWSTPRISAPSSVLRLPPGCRKVLWSCRLEDGEERSGRGGGGANSNESDSPMPLPSGLPLGYHRLELEAGGVNAQLDLIVAPDRCHLPAELGPGARSWGLSCQLYGLRSERNWGMGDFTDLARLARAAGSLHRIGGRHQSAARAVRRRAAACQPLFAFEPQPARLSLHRRDGGSRLCRGRDGTRVDRRRVVRGDSLGSPLGRAHRLWRRRRLQAAGTGSVVSPLPVIASSARTGRQPASWDRRSAIFSRAGGNRSLILPYSKRCTSTTFATSDSSHGAAGRRRCAIHDRRRLPTLLPRIAIASNSFSFCNGRPTGSWPPLREPAARPGLSIGLYRDLAVGADPNGAEAWADQELVAPGASIGAPPDALSRGGQNWGLAPVNPLVLRRQGFAPFIASLRANMRHAGILRIDHVMSLNRLYWIPSGMEAKAGAYVNYPFDDLLRLVALESRRQACAVVGEDLGTVPDGFRDTMRSANMLSYRIFVFERKSMGHSCRPTEYPALAAASAATHDIATLKGFWLGTDIAWRRRLGLYPGPACCRSRGSRAPPRSQSACSTRSFGKDCLHPTQIGGVSSRGRRAGLFDRARGRDPRVSRPLARSSDAGSARGCALRGRAGEFARHDRRAPELAPALVPQPRGDRPRRRAAPRGRPDRGGALNSAAE